MRLNILTAVKINYFQMSKRAMSGSKALILGCYKGTDEAMPIKLTPKAEEFNRQVNGKLKEALKSLSFKGSKLRSFTHLSSDYSYVVVGNKKKKKMGYCPDEEVDIHKENVRAMISEGIKHCENNEAESIIIDDCEEEKCVGEVISLTRHIPGQWKRNYKPKNTHFELYLNQSDTLGSLGEGIQIGNAQIFAASLAETPANLKTPTMVSEYIKSKMPPNVTCYIRNKEWIKERKMELFLSVNQGSVQPPVLLEAHYKGSESSPIVLVGKGITFDSGGISLKPSLEMATMKADMQGAACVFATIQAIASMKLPIHVIGIAPFTENLPSGTATKPGDVFVASNGKTVEVDNTDAEGRLVLGDALVYAETFSPSQIIDLATLTGAVGVALGSAASAIYTQNNQMLQDFKAASAISGDRVWRMPLFKAYTKMIESDVADLINSTKKRAAGSCTAAAFLKEFVTTKNWAHLDIACTMMCDGDVPYLAKGMSGRPTRTLIEYIKILSNK